MFDEDCSRRAFLKKFAMLSAGSLVLGATAMACYGPGPNYPSVPTVDGMYFLDAQSTAFVLDGAQSVPVHTQFVIEFSTPMNISTMPQVLFTGPSNLSVANTAVWNGSRTLHVTPDADLQYVADYSLGLGNGAEDTLGNSLVLTDRATAAFRTTAG